MKSNLRLFAFGMVASFATSVFANQPSAAAAKEHASKVEAKVREQEDQEFSNSLVKRMAVGVITGGSLIGLGAGGVSFLDRTGLSVGLGISGIPTFFAFAFEGRTRELATKIAMKTPLIGLIGSVVFSDFTMNKLERITALGIDQIAKKMKGISASQGAALFITSAVALTLSKPIYDKVTNATYKKANGVCDYFADALS